MSHPNDPTQLPKLNSPQRFFPDGTSRVSDSTPKIKFPSKVLPGWDLACKGMGIGEKRHVFIPSRLGYAKKGFGKKVAPDTDLFFVFERVK